MAAREKLSSDEFQKLRVCPKIAYDEAVKKSGLFLVNKLRYP